MSPVDSVQAAPANQGTRAGSFFSEQATSYGPTKQGPKRRNQANLKRSNDNYSESDFDYRLSDEEAASDYDYDYEAYEQESYDDSGAEFETGDVDQTGFFSSASCDCVGGCDCGTDVERGCGCDDSIESSCSCGDVGCDDSCCEAENGNRLDACFSKIRSGRPKWHLGFEAVFVQPRFSENVAFNTMESTGNGVSDSVFTDTEFEYDFEFTPRVWIEIPVNKSWSWRVSYWQLDHDPGALTTSPNANGFGEITHPSFGDVDISTTIPTDTFSASSTLNVFTIDAETIKRSRLGKWQLGVGGGVRYASTEQTYFAQLEATGNVLQGQIDFEHKLEGVGPTISLAAKRPLFRKIQLTCSARGSLLFGEGSSRLVAREDINLTASTFSTTRTTSRDDLLPVGEARIGLEWMSAKRRRNWQWLLTSSLEGQIWGNAGNATSETGDLGFFGFNAGIGWLR